MHRIASNIVGNSIIAAIIYLFLQKGHKNKCLVLAVRLRKWLRACKADKLFLSARKTCSFFFSTEGNYSIHSEKKTKVLLIRHIVLVIISQR